MPLHDSQSVSHVLFDYVTCQHRCVSWCVLLVFVVGLIATTHGYRRITERYLERLQQTGVMCASQWLCKVHANRSEQTGVLLHGTMLLERRHP